MKITLYALPVVESPPEPASQTRWLGAGETYLLWLLDPVEDPKDQNYSKTTLKLSGPVKILLCLNFEKNSIDQKCGHFVLEPARLLRVFKSGSRARMDPITGMLFAHYGVQGVPKKTHFQNYAAPPNPPASIHILQVNIQIHPDKI